MKKLNQILTACTVIVLTSATQAADPVTGGQPPSVTQLTVGFQYQDHMVLQREIPVPISGTAEPDAKITVAFKGQVKETVADKDGKWSVPLDSLPADKQPAIMTIDGPTDRIELTQVSHFKKHFR